jgi:hypothetical protein
MEHWTNAVPWCVSKGPDRRAKRAPGSSRKAAFFPALYQNFLAANCCGIPRARGLLQLKAQIEAGELRYH